MGLNKSYMLTHSSLKLDASLEAGKISEDKFHIKRFASSEELTNDESVEVAYSFSG